MSSLSLPHSPPLQLNPPRVVPSFPRFTLFRCSANLRASLNSQNSRGRVRLSAARQPVVGKLAVECFASISSSNSQGTTSVGVNPQSSVSPPPSTVGSPLFWFGVGVAFSAVFAWVAGRVKNYAMQQALKTVMGQMSSQNDQFSNAAFSPGSPFPFPGAPMSPSASPFSASSQPSFTDISATGVDASVPAASAAPSTPTTDVKDEETNKKQNRFAFVDVTPEEAVQPNPFESSLSDTEVGSSKGAKNNVEGSQNGAAFKPEMDASMGSQNTGKENSVLSVEALEKMLEDPTVQKMVYP